MFSSLLKFLYSPIRWWLDVTPCAYCDGCGDTIHSRAGKIIYRKCRCCNGSGTQPKVKPACFVCDDCGMMDDTVCIACEEKKAA